MDESRSVCRCTRRLAVAAVICCGTVYAEEPQASSIRGLLQKGWSANQLADGHFSQELRLPTVPSLFRPELKPIEVPDVLTPESIVRPRQVARAGESAKASGAFDAPIVSPSLARLIQSRTERTEQPARFNNEGIRLDLAPSVRRVDVERQAAMALDAKMETADQRVTAATPFQPVADREDDSHANPDSPSIGPESTALTMPSLSGSTDGKEESTGPISGPTPVENFKQAKQGASQPTTEILAAASSTPTKEVANPTESEPSMASLLQRSGNPTPRRLKNLVSDQSRDSVVDSRPERNTEAALQLETELEDTELAESIAEVPAERLLPELPIPSEVGKVKNEPIASARSPKEAGRESADTAEEKLTQLPMPDSNLSLPISQLARQNPVTEQQALGSSLQVTRLRKLAQESLQTAYDRAARGADHSAKKYATEALRLSVATRDAMEGGNRHTRSLAVAFDAIRESEDFCGRYGPANPNTLGRMIVSHQTTVLKESDPDRLSAYEAADAYLSFARHQLVSAGGTMTEASHALVLLGRLEKRVSRSGRTYCDAVSVTLHRAAIDIEPANAAAHCALGSTLLEQGLTEQASLALQRSVEISPTRTAYKGLLEVARRSGDAVAARACTAALNHPALGSDVPVMQMDVDSFVQTHRPNEIPSHLKQEQSPAAASQDEAPRIGLRSLFPFTRR